MIFVRMPVGALIQLHFLATTLKTMNDFQQGVLFYVPLQLVSFVLLPKWWRLAAVPALIAAPGIFFHGGYMGDVFATMWMIFACAYLVVVWVIVGVVKLIRVLLAGRRSGADIP